MENRMTVAGFGGQGVLVIGQLLCYAACMNDKHALFLPKYGAEQRGGTARCDVTISDSAIYSPFTRYVDILMALNQPSLDKYSETVKAGGTLLLNSSRCIYEGDKTKLSVYCIPADRIAEEIGAAKVANIVMLGAYIRQSGVLTHDEVMRAIELKLGKKPQYMEMNRLALQRGMDAV